MNINRQRMLIFSMLVILVLVIFRYWSAAEGVFFTLFQASQPFILGAMIAYIVNILMDGYERLYLKLFKSERALKAKRGISLTLAYSTFIIVVIIIMGIVIPELIKAVQSLLSIDPQIIQDWFEKIEDNEIVKKIVTVSQRNADANLDISSTIADYVQQMISTIGNILLGILTSASGVFSAVINGLMGIIFSMYLLSSKELLAVQIKKLMVAYLPDSHKKIEHVLGIFDQSFRDFFISQTIEAVILGVLCFIGMLMFRFPFASTISILTGSANIIPILGAYMGGLVGFILVLTTSFSKALVFIVFIIVLQQLESNLIYPRVVGGSVGLPAMWVLLAVSIGGALGGVIGMLISVPTAAALYKILKIDVYSRLVDEEEFDE